VSTSTIVNPILAKMELPVSMASILSPVLVLLALPVLDVKRISTSVLQARV
jgi:hypothetical protein